MRRLALACALSVTACSGDHPAVVVEKQVLVVPSDLRDCPVLPVGIPAPRPPRTQESVLAWVRLVEDLRKETQDVAITCRKRLRELNGLVGEARR